MPYRRLAELLPESAGPAGAVAVSGLTADSRAVAPGYLFAALPGSKADGRAFVARAVESGAVAVLAPAGAGILAPVPVIAVDDPRRALALAAARFYGAQPRIMAAVTGTNGKTSVAQFLRQIWSHAGFSAAAIGTLGVTTRTGSRELGMTTPDPVTLHRVLGELAMDGVDHAVLEASSHGLVQRRLDGVALAAAAFTNITRDHLDYHADAGDYFRAKRRLFDTLLPPGGTAVVNLDGAGGAEMAEAARARGLKLLTIGRTGADIALLEREATASGQRLLLRLSGGGAQRWVELPLAGDFQASNALMALGLALATGVAAETGLDALAALAGVPGRLELVGTHTSGAPVFVDYAHTPDALSRVLAALRPHAERRLIVVFGAGGDRDPGKRPEMGRAAGVADRLIVTDDNPRSEEPAAIRAAILQGAPKAVEIGDRAAAIVAALSDLQPGDLVVIAGKGHEQGQIYGGETRPFDDRAVARAALNALNRGRT